MVPRKETTCNYHCYMDASPASNGIFSFLPQTYSLSLPIGNANFCVLRKRGPLFAIASPGVLHDTQIMHIDTQISRALKEAR